LNKVPKKINFTSYANTNRGLEIILGWKLTYFLVKDGHIQGIEATCSMHKADYFAQTRQGLKRKARNAEREAIGEAIWQRTCSEKPARGAQKIGYFA
jgi:hypothetical protein